MRFIALSHVQAVTLKDVSGGERKEVSENATCKFLNLKNAILLICTEITISVS